jgi:hypothetical protein
MSTTVANDRFYGLLALIPSDFSPEPNVAEAFNSFAEPDYTQRTTSAYIDMSIFLSNLYNDLDVLSFLMEDHNWLTQDREDEAFTLPS